MNVWLVALAAFAVGSLSGPVVFLAMWQAYRRQRRQALTLSAALKGALSRLARAREELRTCREKQQTVEVAELLTGSSYRGFV